MFKYIIMFNIFFCASYALAMEEAKEEIGLTWETPGEHVLASLQKLGRYDLEEYWKINNFAVDPSIETLFAWHTNSSESSDFTLLENARKHPKLRISPQQELRKAGQDKALGLFAGETILKGQPIIEYVGQTKVLFSLVGDESNLLGWLPVHLSRDEAEQSHYNFGFQQHENISNELWKKGKMFAPSSDDLVFVDVCIDPARRGNVARFANHSVKWANAELTVVPEFIDGQVYLHPLLIALRDIKLHEEILWNYGKENSYIELKGKKLNQKYIGEFELNFNGQHNKLRKTSFFHDNLTSKEAKKLLVEPASYLLRQENSRLFLCVNGQDYRLDENFEPVDRTEFVEMEFWIINERFTFEPNRRDYGHHSHHDHYFDNLWELRKSAKLRLCAGDSYLTIRNKKAVRRQRDINS